MKICSVCNEIVSANQRCALSNCPNKGSARPAPKSRKVIPGPTGRSDRTVQAGLDRAGDVARDATRRVVFAGAITLAVAVAAAFLLLTNMAKFGSNAAQDASKQKPSGDVVTTSSGLRYKIIRTGEGPTPSDNFRLEKVSITGADNEREIQVYPIVLKYMNRSPDLDDIDHKIRDLPWVKDVSLTVRPPSSLSIDIDSKLDETFMKLPPLRGEGAERNVLGLQNILSRKPQFSSRIESAEWIGNRRWDLRFETGQKLKLPEGTAAAAEAFVSFADANAERNLLSSNATEFDMRVPSELLIRTE